MAIPLVLYAIWFLDEDRLVAFSVVALFVCLTKEEIPLAVGCLGIWYAVRKGRRRFGFGVFAIGLAITLFDFLWLIPHFSATGVEPFAHRYQAVGGTPMGIARELFTNPVAFAHAVGTGHKAFYLGILFIPLLGLALLEPLLLLGAVPDLAINLLSNLSDQTSITNHWSAGIVPFVIAASIFGAARFKRQAVGLSLWMLVGTGCVAILSPILHVSRDIRALGSPALASKEYAVGLIPDGVPVSASIQLGGHLSERRYIYTFPYAVKARWIIVDSNDPTYGRAAAYKRYVRRYEASKAWRVVYSSHGIDVLLRRSGPP